MDKLTPDVVSTPSGITEAQTDKFTMGLRRCGRKVSGSTSVHTQVRFAEFWARYLGSIELLCIPRLVRQGI